VTEAFDVRIDERLYDAAKGVTVVRVSYVPSNCRYRVTLKGVAFTSPEDRNQQTKREGTFHAIRHACEYLACDYIDILDEAMLAAVRQGLFSWDVPPPSGVQMLDSKVARIGTPSVDRRPGTAFPEWPVTREPNVFQAWPPEKSTLGPLGQFGFVVLG
jgi:hypothetical protein